MDDVTSPDSVRDGQDDMSAVVRGDPSRHCGGPHSHISAIGLLAKAAMEGKTKAEKALEGLLDTEQVRMHAIRHVQRGFISRRLWHECCTQRLRHFYCP